MAHSPAATAVPSRLADVPVLLVAVVWGSSYLAAKGVTTSGTVLAVLVLRFGVVLPVLVVAGWRRLRALSGTQVRGAGGLGVILAGIFVLESYGVVHTSATNAGLIISLTMVFTPVGPGRAAAGRVPGGGRAVGARRGACRHRNSSSPPKWWVFVD